MHSYISQLDKYFVHAHCMQARKETTTYTKLQLEDFAWVILLTLCGSVQSVLSFSVER